MATRVIKQSILLVVLSAAIIAGVTSKFFLNVNKTTKPYIYTDIENVPSAQVGMVLGAAVFRNGTLSLVLKDRTNTAIALYKNKKIEKILVTGDNSRKTYDEVTPVQDYLLKNNIPTEDIFLDHAGFDTYSSMYRARDVFLADSLIIISQSFHLPRATYIARQLGITAYAISADKREYKTRNYIREVPATMKALIDLAVNRKPKFLGEPIPIPAK